MLIKYPHLRKTDSFINIIINSNLTDACLKIATYVLMLDEDCYDFVTNSDLIFNSGKDMKIIDETNDRVL